MQDQELLPENKKKIALLIVYNHRYDKNIPVIEAVYKNRFRYIYHLMPFYDGEEENVIPVYEASGKFQSYIAQAYQKIKDKNFTHYFIVADDAFLNPGLTENNLFEKMGLNENDCFITNLFELHLQKKNEYPLSYTIHKPGAEVKNILPDYSEAVTSFNRYGLKTSKIKVSLIIKFLLNSFFSIIRSIICFKFKETKIWTKSFLTEVYFLFNRRNLKYPLIWGYSDVLIVTKDIMPKFCTYCGAFAATGLFVEYAIPTALVLSTSDNLVLEKNIKLKGLLTLEYNEKCSFKLSELKKKFPENTLFIHPIKLSKWK